MQQAQTGRWAVAAMFATNGFVMGAWAPQIPLLLTRHDITTSMLGLLILGLGLGAVAAMLFAGRLIQTYGSRSIARAFGLATAPALPLVVLAPNLPLLALAMALMGALIGCMDVAMNANAVEVERRLGRAIMSSSHGFWSLGGFVGGIAGSYVIAKFGAESQALTVAALALITVLLAGPKLLADAPHPTETKPEPHALFPRDASLWILGFMALFCMVPEGAVLDWAAIYLNRELGADLFRSGLGFAGFAATMALMRFAGDRLRNRFGAVKTLQISGLISAAGLLGAGFAPNDITAIACFTFAGLGVANMVPILFSAAGNHPGMAAGAAISTVTMVGYAGILIAPSSIGFIGDHIGFRATYAALAVVLLIVTALAPRVKAADGLKPL
ncbi:MFS transporter [Cypionkella aquatica]|uniref:MFS transporter n=1 Tax=Cypionkella aquatica TaxID=1756042 RepID=A0AA37U104_9RHOB|nr:MFS transporter [Cypionkella aquatica]GLS85704.1 MFS transporter [Cypionkella aquatica]